MSGSEHINKHSVTHSDSSEVLPEDVRREYLLAMDIQPWYDPSLKLDVTPIQTPVLKDSSANVLPQESAEIDIVEADVIKTASTEKTETVQLNTVKSEINVDSNVADITSLHEVVQQCHMCELHATRKLAIAGEGNSSADLMVVTSSPVTESSGDGVLFSSMHKEFLQLVLQAIDIDLSTVYLTSLVKCQPPEQRQPFTSEVICCDEHLTNQIKIIKPKVIMVLGEQASQQLLVSQKSLTDLRLRHHQHLSVPVYASYHPEEIIGSIENKRKVWQDLLQIKKQLHKSVAT